MPINSFKGPLRSAVVGLIVAGVGAQVQGLEETYWLVGAVVGLLHYALLSFLGWLFTAPEG